MQSRLLEWSIRWWIAIGLLIAIVIRAIFFFEPLWLDELHTAWVIEGPFSQVGPRAAIGNQSPLYFWLVWPITYLTSLSPSSLRALSLLAGLVLVAFAGHLVFKWTHSAAACATVVILGAIDPTLIFYATEARTYSGLQLAGCIQIAILWALWDRLSTSNNGGRRRIWTLVVALSVCSAILVYLHFTAFLLFFAEAVFVAMMVLVKSISGQLTSNVLKTFLVVFVFTLLLCLPAIGHVVFVFGRSQNWTSVSSVENLLAEQIFPIMCLLGLPMVITGVLAIAGQLIPNGLEKRIQLLCLLAAIALIPTLSVCLADRIQLAPLALTRYIVISGVAMILFAAIVVGSAKSKPVQWGLAAIFMALNIFINPIAQSLVTAGEILPFRREMWAAPIAQINQYDGQLQRPVFLFANLLEDRNAASDQDFMFQNYLKFPVRGIYKIENQNRILPRSSFAISPLSQSDVELIEQQGSAWLLFRSTRQHAEQILLSLESQIQKPTRIDTFSSPDSDVILVMLNVGE